MELPSIVSNPPLPYGVYKKMEEDERYNTEIELLKNNYNQLLELTKLKDEEIKSSKRYNRIMLIIAIVSAIIALFSLILTIILS